MFSIKIEITIMKDKKLYMQYENPIHETSEDIDSHIFAFKSIMQVVSYAL